MVPLAIRNRALRVLSLEEDPLQRKLLSACLDAVGVEAFFASRAPEAIFLFRRHPVDMVFMDIDQHSQAGLAAFEGIRATPRRGRGVPILAMTNNECRWTEQDYRDAGFVTMFLKPVEPMRLFLAIDSVLRETAQPPLLEDGALKEMLSQVA